jgi:hypothetical protein
VVTEQFLGYPAQRAAPYQLSVTPVILAVMDGWTIGADIGTMLTGVAVVATAGVWLISQWRAWRSAKNRKDSLLPGQSLLVGQSLYSPDGRTRFSLQQDANMVVQVQGYGGVFDQTDTVGSGVPKCLKLEQNGSLILYDTEDRQLWKKGPGGVRLVVQDNAHVVLYPASGKAIWSTDWLLARGTPSSIRHGDTTPAAQPCDRPSPSAAEAGRPE